MTERRVRTITFWVAINQDGEHHIDHDCAQDAVDGVGGAAVRVAEINLTMEIPQVETVNINVTAPAREAPMQVNATVS